MKNLNLTYEGARLDMNIGFAIQLIRYHYDKNEETFKKYCRKLIEELFKIGEDEIAGYIQAQLGDVPTFSPQQDVFIINREDMIRCMRDGCTYQQLHIILDYIDNLKNNYCNRTDCSGRIKDSKKYNSIQEKIDKALGHIVACGHELSKDECIYLEKILQGND